MAEYESVMNLNVVRPVKVTGVSRTTMGTFLVDTDCLLGGSVARWEARTVISGEWVGLVRCLSKAVPPGFDSRCAFLELEDSERRKAVTHDPDSSWLSACGSSCSVGDPRVDSCS